MFWLKYLANFLFNFENTVTGSLQTTSAQRNNALSDFLKFQDTINTWNVSGWTGWYSLCFKRAVDTITEKCLYPPVSSQTQDYPVWPCILSIYCSACKTKFAWSFLLFTYLNRTGWPISLFIAFGMRISNWRDRIDWMDNTDSFRDRTAACAEIV